MCHHTDIEAWELLREDLDEIDEIVEDESPPAQTEETDPSVDATEPIADD